MNVDTQTLVMIMGLAFIVIAIGLACTLFVSKDARKVMEDIGKLAGKIGESGISLKFNPYPSLLNRYCGPLLAILILSFVAGIWMLYRHNFYGSIPLLWGGLMCQGFREPEDAKPRRVWLITLFNQMTTTKVDGLTLLLDWLPGINVIGHVEFELKVVDEDIAITKEIICIDNVYIVGFVSVAYLPDELDDPADLKPILGDEWRTGGEKLRDFGNVGGIEAARKQIDDVFTVWMQNFANENDSVWMERNIQNIGEDFLACVTGLKGERKEFGNSKLDDTRGLGIRFKKFQPILKAVPKVIEARTDVKVQTEKRRAELVNTQTMNDQIIARLSLYQGIKNEDGSWRIEPTPKNKVPRIDEIRNQIVQENLEHDGKLTQVLNEGGLNLVKVPSN